MEHKTAVLPFTFRDNLISILAVQVILLSDKQLGNAYTTLLQSGNVYNTAYKEPKTIVMGD